jgi:hypothetical protein
MELSLVTPLWTQSQEKTRTQTRGVDIQAKPYNTVWEFGSLMMPSCTAQTFLHLTSLTLLRHLTYAPPQNESSLSCYCDSST